MMRSVIRTFYLLLLLVLLPLFSFSEGTKQILLSDAGHGKVEVMPSFNNFAWYTSSGTSASEEYRLHIRIANIGEVIYYGFGDPLNSNDNIVNDVNYRIKDPLGNIVVGPITVPLSGTGHISTFAEAVAGPNAIAGGSGYPQLSYTPLLTGDYFIEFNFNTGFGGHDRTKFKYFDITVGSAANLAIDGRVWSKAWQFTTDDYNLTFEGKLYVYADDGIVTSINFNGMEPFVFTVSCNQYGCYNTGIFNNDRRSVTGNHTLPQYKNFLNDPDSLVFPTGILGSIVPPITMNATCDGSAVIQLTVTKAGNASILLNLNPLPGVQAEDVNLSGTLSAGMNPINWDGLNGLGVPVPSGTSFDIIVTYINGLTNLPIYDVESNPGGFIVQLARPTGTEPLTYWDDHLIPGGSIQLNGCAFVLPSTGCHTWIGSGSSGIGNNNTINTWWYAVSTTAAPVTFTELRTPTSTGTITGPASLCPGSTNQIYWVHKEANSTSYIWGYTGTGATITNISDTMVSVNFSGAATSGNITVSGSNLPCGVGPASTKAITILSLPVVTLAPFFPVCTNTPAFTLTGGSPSGGTYEINGISAPIFNPSVQGVGTFTITYTYTDPTSTCTGSASKTITVNAAPIVTLSPFTTVCTNTPAFTLTGGNPSGGTYSGTGVIAGVFDPSVSGAGIFTITYTYTNANNCVSSATSPITVNQATPVTVAAFTPVCINSAPFTLTQGSPAGGVYSGAGVNAGTFNPATAGIGTHMIVYTYTNSFGCITADSNSIIVNPLPGTPGNISGATAVCQGASNINYTIPAIANAVSYSWSVSPVAAGTILGSSTTGTINWSAAFSGTAFIFVEGVNNCGNGPQSIGYQVTVNPKPAVTYSMCTDSITKANAKVITLKGGIPLGGTYTGVGVNSGAGTFNPATAGNGAHTIRYTYINSQGCSSYADRTITVVGAGLFTCGNTLTDVRDNKQYPTVLIGSQCWMATNLNYGTQRLSSIVQRDNCVVEKYCYNDAPSNCNTQGGLYQWDEVMQYSSTAGIQGICPPAWHLPAETEWNTLFSNYINNGFAANALKSTGYSGFNAFLSGVDFFNKSWNWFNFATMFWTSVSNGPYKAWAHGMNSYDPSVSYYPSARSNAFSVRCIKD